MSRSRDWYSRKWFESFPKIKAWLDNFRSDHTRMNYLKYFRVFCHFFDVENPENILENTTEENNRLVQEFQENYQDYKGKELKKVLKSLLKFYGMKLDLPLFDGRDEYGHFIKRPGVYEVLRENENIRYWIVDFKSEHTKRQYLYYMHKFLTKYGLTPEELLELPMKKVKRLLKEMRSEYIQQDKSQTAQRLNMIIKSYFDIHEVPLIFTKKDKVQAPRKRKAYIPSKAEVYKIVDACGNLRNKAIFLSLFQSGVRINCLTRWTYGMVKDYLYPEIKVPVRLEITSNLDTKLKAYDLDYYYSFLQDEATEALKTYIEWRKKVQGWEPKDSDLIFVSDPKYGERRPVSLSTLGKSLKKTAKKVGINPDSIWIHCFRKAFRKVLYKAELDPDLSEAIMGHKIPGNRHNYFDYADLNWICESYMECGFSREGVGRMEYLQQKVKEQNNKLKTFEERDEKLETDIKRMLEEQQKTIAELSEKIEKLEKEKSK